MAKRIQYHNGQKIAITFPPTKQQLAKERELNKLKANNKKLESKLKEVDSLVKGLKDKQAEVDSLVKRLKDRHAEKSKKLKDTNEDN